MIYVKISENLVTLSNESTEFDNILYALNWDLQKLINILRPWRALWKTRGIYFKPSVIDDFFEVWKFEENPPEEEYDKFSQNIYDALMSIALELSKYGLIKMRPEFAVDFPKYKLEYNCDILNLLEDVYSEEAEQLIENFFSLEDKEVNFIREFYSQLTKEKKTQYLRENVDNINLDSCSDYLPSWCKDDLKMFGFNKIPKNLNLVPEFRDSRPLAGGDEVKRKREMIEEIYSEFEIGSVLKGSEIRTRFRNIYSKYGLNPKATLVDFMEYFVIRKARSEYEWSYRIVRRKKDEVLGE